MPVAFGIVTPKTHQRQSVWQNSNSGCFVRVSRVISWLVPLFRCLWGLVEGFQSLLLQVIAIGLFQVLCTVNSEDNSRLVIDHNELLLHEVPEGKFKVLFGSSYKHFKLAVKDPGF